MPRPPSILDRMDLPKLQSLARAMHVAYHGGSELGYVDSIFGLINAIDPELGELFMSQPVVAIATVHCFIDAEKEKEK